MKFKDLYLFLEQEDQDNPNVDADGNLIDADGNPIPFNPEVDDINVDDDIGDIDIENPPLPDGADRPNVPPRPKKLSLTQQIKQKWKSESPGLTEFQLADAIGFFAIRRDGLRPYHPYGYQENGRHYINVPEITTLAARFPNMIPVFENKSTLLDLKLYPWSVMEFWMDFIREDNTVIDEENIVPGTTLPIDEQLTIAKERWQDPANQIINEGGVIVYKIESKNESIALGSIQRVLSLKRKQEGNSRGNLYWCTTVPINDRGRSNLWTNYRPSNGFYYVWDQNKNEDDKYYATAILAKRDGTYGFVDLYNATTTGHNWAYFVGIYPQLNDKQQLFPWFGTTRKETTDLTLNKISMNPDNEYYFGGIPKSWQYAYVESGKHVPVVDAFLTMEAKTRKLYVEKTTKLNNDLQSRFVCSDPDTPFGIIDILRLETKPDNLLKLLEHKLNILEVPGGVLAIKKLIIGTNWRRWITDEKTNNTIITPQTNRIDKNSKFGVINVENAEMVKDIKFVITKTRSYIHQYDEDGVTRRKRYITQKYNITQGDGNVDMEEYFYIFTTPEALTVKNSPDYLKGRMFEGPEGDEFIREKLATRELIQI